MTAASGGASWLLAQEASALLARLDRVEPLVLHETMVPAAAVPPVVQAAIERFLARRRREVRDQARAFLIWLASRAGREAPAAEGQRRLTLLRLRFNNVLTQFDIFADVMTQRSEHGTGVWLAGLDVLAADALAIPGGYFQPPPVVCYLDRGHGAAIRRARTRLPGGGWNPVAIVRVPRERMIGSGVGSSLVHEVGHQGSELLRLRQSLRPVLRGLQRSGGARRIAWILYERWLGEILADLWAVARLGFTALLGFIGVLSLPRAFVFRIDPRGSHPAPWIRFRLVCALGHALYPHGCWSAVSRLWISLYPLEGLRPRHRRLIDLLEDSIPALVAVLVHHRPPALRGRSLAEALASPDLHPSRLAARGGSMRSTAALRRLSPTLAVAALGQTRAEGRINPEQESAAIARLLTTWALQRTLGSPAVNGGPLILDEVRSCGGFCSETN